jgi:septal ring factor EnvC (AmiA/AmiB activator)
MARKLVILSLLLLLCCVPSIGMAAEITDQELTRLEAIFNQLESNNKTQETKLMRASELLKKSETQINLLNEKLSLAEQSISQAQNSLAKANQSLQAYEKEVKRERNKLKFERNLLLIAVGVLAFR